MFQEPTEERWAERLVQVPLPSLAVPAATSSSCEYLALRVHLDFHQSKWLKVNSGISVLCVFTLRDQVPGLLGDIWEMLVSPHFGSLDRAWIHFEETLEPAS